jgi:hypothetical protein
LSSCNTLHKVETWEINIIKYSQLDVGHEHETKTIVGLGESFYHFVLGVNLYKLENEKAWVDRHAWLVPHNQYLHVWESLVAIRIVDQMGGYFAITSKHCKIDVT